MVVLFWLIPTLPSNNRDKPVENFGIKSIDIYWHKVYNGINIKRKDIMQPQYDKVVIEQLKEINKLIQEINEKLKG